MKSFDEFIQEQLRMCDESTFRDKIAEAYNFHKQNITKMVDKEKGIYHAMVQDLGRSPSWKEVEINFDADHLAYVEDVLSKPATMILNHSTGDVSAKELDIWITKIERALLLTQLNNFYYNFPNYLKGLELTLDKLKEIEIHFSLKKKKRGNKNFKKTLSLSDEAKIINYSFELLQKDPDKYKPKRGAYVSELLKDKVTDDLKSEIPKISRDKVSRLLLKYYAETKA